MEALWCRCGNIEVCLRTPPDKVVDHVVQPPSQSKEQRLGTADLVSAVHRVPELVRASEHHASDSSAKWCCYECRLCRVGMVYACRVENVQQTSGVASSRVFPAFSSPAGEQIVTEGTLVNLDLADAPQPAAKDDYSHAFKIVLSPDQRDGHRTDISKLLGAAGAQGFSLFERLTDQVDSWFSQHLRDLALSARGVTQEQERSIRKNALRERDAIFVKICQENGIGSGLASLARVAETLATAITTERELLMDNDDDDNDMDDDHDFEERCRDLSEFKERHGHCRVPRGWKENVYLSNWVRNLRRKKIRGTLSSDKIARLEEMGFVWRKERKDSWEEHFAQLVDFSARFGHCRVTRNWKENIKLGQWVQSLRRLKLSGRLSDDKIARLESIGFEWRLRQKEDGLSQESRDGEQPEASDDSDSDGDSYPDDDVYSEEEIVSTHSSQTKAMRWFKEAEQELETSRAQVQRRTFADTYDGAYRRMDGLVNIKSRSILALAAASTTATTTTTPTARMKKSKARLPRSPSFSLNDIDEDLYDNYGHGKYYDEEDDEDEEFDAALDDDEEEDDEWAGGAKTTSRSKRKRATEKKAKRSQGSEQRPTSPPGQKSGVRACVECGATKTPHWRRGPTDKQGDPAFLCNACGLRYYKTLQQKSTKKKTRSSTKKQKTRRGSEDEQSASQETKKESNTKSKKKKKPKTIKAEKSTDQKSVIEAVTDSDSESREGRIIDGLVVPSRSGKKQRSLNERASARAEEEREDEAELMGQAAGGENAHVPWLLAFKQQRKEATTGGQDKPTSSPTRGVLAPKEEDDEIFDFVE